MGRDAASSTLRPRPQPIDAPRVPALHFEDKRQKRQSLRLRPTEILDNAEPPSPLKDPSLKSVSASTFSSTMSLFNLFSRPKVERARGHTEKVAGPPPVPRKNTLKSSASTPNLVVHVQSNSAVPPTPTQQPPLGPPTKVPFGLKSRNPSSKPSSRERKPGSFDPPPLFQAYPQSLKDGVLESATLAADGAAQKSRTRRSGHLQAEQHSDGADETLSVDTKRSAMAHLKHVASGSVSHVELPKKIFVLVTSGYLLQYAESGPSDRLPEKMLHLGKDSATFACDLVAGKHYVLQVSHEVDQDGIVVANSGSIFSKLGIRSAAAKRLTTNFLLVMPNAQEMETWMNAIRREIEILGGAKAPAGASARPQGPVSTYSDLKKSPSQSHRYNVSRNPSKVSSMNSPAQETPPPMPLPSPARSDDKSDTATIDGIEMEASKLKSDEPQPATRTRSPSDAPSMTSSAAVSVDQQQLNNLRSSGSNKRISYTSQAGTVTTVANSRTNSFTGSPPSEGFATGSLDAMQESAATRPGYRTLSSYGNRRRSAAPASMAKEQHISALDTSPQKLKPSTIEQDVESPVVGHGSPPPQLTTSHPNLKRLSMARSEPNLQSTKAKHDSKMSPPPLPRDADKDRPESFVGDLPPPSAWNSSRAGSRRTSMLQSAAALTAQAQQSSAQPQSPPPNPPPSHPPPATPEVPRPKRMSTFSMPLKINPSGQNTSAASAGRKQRQPSVNDPDPAGPEPVVHAITAKVDHTPRSSITSVSVTNDLKKSPSQRLSLFPTALPTPPPTSPEPRISPPSTAQANAQQPQPQPSTQANIRTLRRPTSMQVRSDPAPFLSSVRNSTGPPAVRNFTAPIAPMRGLKPSRSASNITSLAAAQSSTSDAFKGLDFGLPPPKEDDDQAMPLPKSRTQSPLPLLNRPGSRSSAQRMSKTRSSLPELDLGIPVVGLGPPAPPPSAPLPSPPVTSRPSSRLGARSVSPTPSNGGSGSQGIDAIAGLGIRVS